MNDVIALGNALVDVLICAEKETLEKLGVQIGGSNHLSSEILKFASENRNKVISSGGSAANVLAVLASLGDTTIFVGTIGTDKYGILFQKELESLGVKANLVKAQGLTGCAITFITPDSERTFAVDLGVASKIEKTSFLDDEIKNSRILHVESYLLGDEKSKAAVFYALSLAKKNKVLVSVDLNDVWLIKKYYSDVKKLAENADIIFMNEEESIAFTGITAPVEAIKSLSNKIVVLKLGANGSLIKENILKMRTVPKALRSAFLILQKAFPALKRRNFGLFEEKIYEVPAFKVDAVDTTGAGDSYAAGILHGIINGIPILESGRTASFIASKVVQQIGARFKGNIKKELEGLK